MPSAQLESIRSRLGKTLVRPCHGGNFTGVVGVGATGCSPCPAGRFTLGGETNVRNARSAPGAARRAPPPQAQQPAQYARRGGLLAPVRLRWWSALRVASESTLKVRARRRVRRAPQAARQDRRRAPCSAAGAPEDATRRRATMRRALIVPTASSTHRNTRAAASRAKRVLLPANRAMPRSLAQRVRRAGSPLRVVREWLRAKSAPQVPTRECPAQARDGLSRVPRGKFSDESNVATCPDCATGSGVSSCNDHAVCAGYFVQRCHSDDIQRDLHIELHCLRQRPELRHADKC